MGGQNVVGFLSSKSLLLVKKHKTDGEENDNLSGFEFGAIIIKIVCLLKLHKVFVFYFCI